MDCETWAIKYDSRAAAKEKLLPFISSLKFFSLNANPDWAFLYKTWNNCPQFGVVSLDTFAWIILEYRTWRKTYQLLSHAIVIAGMEWIWTTRRFTQAAKKMDAIFWEILHGMRIHSERKTIFTILHLNVLIINSWIFKERKNKRESVQWCPNKIRSLSQFAEEFLI